MPSSVHRLRAALFAGCALAFIVVAHVTAAAQQPPLKGAAALAHPAVQEALTAIDLLKAGKIEEAMARRTKSEQTDWKRMSAADRKELGAGIMERTPTAKAFADAVRSNGELSIDGTSAVLAFTVGAARGAAYLEREGTVWRVANGPMVFSAPAAPAKEERIENADILTHPIGVLAAQYLDLVHAGRMDDAMKISTASAQAKWKNQPASEKAESLAYDKKNLPTRAAMTTGLQRGDIHGILVIEDDTLATLNLIVTTQRTQGATVTSSSTTQAMGFEKEGGVWKVR